MRFSLMRRSTTSSVEAFSRARSRRATAVRYVLISACNRLSLVQDAMSLSLVYVCRPRRIRRRSKSVIGRLDHEVEPRWRKPFGVGGVARVRRVLCPERQMGESKGVKPTNALFG